MSGRVLGWQVTKRFNMAKMLWKNSQNPSVTAFLAAWVIRRLPHTLCEPSEVDERAGVFDEGAKMIIERFTEQAGDEHRDLLLRQHLYYVADGRQISRSLNESPDFDADHEELLLSEPTYSMLSRCGDTFSFMDLSPATSRICSPCSAGLIEHVPSLQRPAEEDLPPARR